MYGLPGNLDLEFILEREVIQIAIGVYQVIMAFDKQLKISIEGEFEYITKEGRLTWKPTETQVAAKTVGLLGATVQSVNPQANGTLELGFSNSDRLVLKHPNPQYESYQIVTPVKTIVV